MYVDFQPAVRVQVSNICGSNPKQNELKFGKQIVGSLILLGVVGKEEGWINYLLSGSVDGKNDMAISLLIVW